MSMHPTGEQYAISHGRYRAVVTEVGASLRSLQVDGTEWLWTFTEDEVPPKSAGRQLIPWPNRIRDGRYTFEDTEYQLPISEVPLGVALHGLNEGFAWDLVHRSEKKVVQRHTFHPQAGWPGTLTVTLHHNMTEDGLVVVVHVDNDGATSAPYGYGVHPYFAFDDVGDVVLELPFASELEVDPQRLLPVQLMPPSPSKDFRTPRAVANTELDTAFTEPTDTDWVARLAGPHHTVEVWGTASTPWVQVFTRPDRAALAVEPMTCGPDAFNEGPTHQDLIVLAPGGSHVTTWGIRAG